MDGLLIRPFQRSVLPLVTSASTRPPLAVQTAVLDGLGAVGDNDHAPGEYLELDTLALQIKRAALLLHRLSH